MTNSTLISSDLKSLNNEVIMAIIMGITMVLQSLVGLLIVFIKLCKSSSCCGNKIDFRDNEALDHLKLYSPKNTTIDKGNQPYIFK